jgi:hypothetical protein
MKQVSKLVAGIILMLPVKKLQVTTAPPQWIRRINILTSHFLSFRREGAINKSSTLIIKNNNNFSLLDIKKYFFQVFFLIIIKMVVNIIF